MIGRRLSHYDITAEISRGGMGVVYRAVDTSLGREVAIKVLPDDLLQDPDRRARLLHEARAASALEHPHIAVIHEVGEQDGVTFIAMELIRGEKLSDVVARHPLPPARALTLAAEIAEGLARAHEKGIVHRDLKPSNVMVTDDGHAKIIDFGLATSVERADAQGVTATLASPRTGEGIVLGTAAYMSPEQARGERVDHRTDVFALGVTLYEMLTGRPAFQGRSSLETLQAILTQPVPPLPASGGASSDAGASLQHIVAKCTAKEPEERYQGMKDLVVDLRAARRRLESTEDLSHSRPSPVAAAPRSRRSLRPAVVIPLGLVLVTLLAGAAVFWKRDAAPPPAGASSGRPAVAVMYFENNTGDESLDWMRTGLTDMLVTNLSQSRDLEVVGTDRLVQILQDLGRADERVISADLIREIADRARVEKVLVGSYIRAGGTIRISARLQDAATGSIVTAERVEGEGEAALFGLVDELTRRVKSSLATSAGPAPASLLRRPGAPVEPDLERDLAQITTASIDAYRYYAEGIHLHERGLYDRAAPLLEKAVEIDPGFAMAHAKLAVVHNNLGLFAKRDESARRALDRTDRLTARERYYIEGFVYGLRLDTLGRSIDAYKQGLALHPEHHSSRHNLALHYLTLGRYAEGIAESEELLRRGSTNGATWENLVELLLSANQVARAAEVAADFARRQPDDARAFGMLGTVALAEGRLDETREQYDRANASNPTFRGHSARFAVAVLQDRLDDARSIADHMSASPSVFEAYLGRLNGAQIDLAHGRSRKAAAAFREGLALPGLGPGQRAMGRGRLAQTLLRQGDHERARSEAGEALREGEGHSSELMVLQVLAVAQARSGLALEAEQTLARLQARSDALPGNAQVGRLHWVRGEIALHRGDLPQAVRELMAAQATLPQFSQMLGPPSAPHIEFLWSAAVANMRAGHHDEAVALFEKLQRSPQRWMNMEPAVRSHYLLGQLYERRGDQARARQQYARFVKLWGHGDLERGWVADARTKLGR